MMGAVLLDQGHQPVRPAIIWADTRATAQTEQLIELLGEQVAYDLLGHRLNPTYSVEKVMWVRDHEPESFTRTRWVCLAKDFVIHRLTGPWPPSVRTRPRPMPTISAPESGRRR